MKKIRFKHRDYGGADVKKMEEILVKAAREARQIVDNNWSCSVAKQIMFGIPRSEDRYR